MVNGFYITLKGDMARHRSMMIVTTITWEVY